MEDIRPYRNEQDESQYRRREDDRRIEQLEAAAADEEVPFHIPRD
jgi:hypothetical protein